VAITCVRIDCSKRRHVPRVARKKGRPKRYFPLAGDTIAKQIRSASRKLRDNGSSYAKFGEASMNELLVFIARGSGALLWVAFVGPWIARLCGIPVRAAFWRVDRQSQRLTRAQFVLAFGVLIFGVGMSMFNLDSDTIHRVLLEKRWSAKIIDLGLEIALSVFMGIVIGFWCAPTQIGESPVIELDLSQRH
jgi:hypothetical protein